MRSCGQGALWRLSAAHRRGSAHAIYTAGRMGAMSMEGIARFMTAMPMTICIPAAGYASVQGCP